MFTGRNRCGGENRLHVDARKRKVRGSDNVIHTKKRRVVSNRARAIVCVPTTLENSAFRGFMTAMDIN